MIAKKKTQVPFRGNYWYTGSHCSHTSRNFTQVWLSLSLDLTQHEQQVWAGSFAVLCSIPNPIVVLDRLLVAIFDAAVRREIK